MICQHVAWACTIAATILVGLYVNNKNSFHMDTVNIIILSTMSNSYLKIIDSSYKYFWQKHSYNTKNINTFLTFYIFDGKVVSEYIAYCYVG